VAINYDKAQKEHEAKRILFETRRINEHPEGTTVILNILGHSSALVTDYTTVGDFNPDEDTLSLLDAKRGDYLWELAERIEKENDE
jgi:hypothetical protein